jgi:hypothetical protein
MRGSFESSSRLESHACPLPAQSKGRGARGFLALQLGALSVDLSTSVPVEIPSIWGKRSKMGNS